MPELHRERRPLPKLQVQASARAVRGGPHGVTAGDGGVAPASQADSPARQSLHAVRGRREPGGPPHRRRFAEQLEGESAASVPTVPPRGDCSSSTWTVGELISSNPTSSVGDWISAGRRRFDPVHWTQEGVSGQDAPLILSTCPLWGVMDRIGPVDCQYDQQLTTFSVWFGPEPDRIEGQLALVIPQSTQEDIRVQSQSPTGAGEPRNGLV